MLDSRLFRQFGKVIRRIALTWVLPRIVQLPPSEWDEALKQAREAKFDTVELIGVLAGTAFTTYLLRFGADEAEISLQLRFAAQFIAAIPLLILFVGPFYLRCLRRGLEQFIEHRHLAR